MCCELCLFLFFGFIDWVKEMLLYYVWLGNVCELKNVVECLVYCYGSSEYFLDEIVIDFF